MSLSRHFDQIAIALSAVCIVHCLAVPLVIALAPLAALSLGGEEHFHALMLWLVVPTSAVGFTLGFRIHRRPGIVALGAAGVTILAAAALLGHGAWSALTEAAVNVAGSVVLAAAHWHNFQNVRRVHRHGAF